MSSASEIAASAVIFIGFALTIVAIIDPYWEKTDLDSVRVRSNIKFNGLWIQCQRYPSLQATCEPFQSFFVGLPAVLQGGRGFSLLSALLGLSSVIVCTLSVTSFPCSSSKARARNRLRTFAGALGLIAGISMLAGVSWYAAAILQEYNRLRQLEIITNKKVERLVFGEALFIGWVASFFLLMGSLIAICVSCEGSEDERPVPYIPASMPRKEYV